MSEYTNNPVYKLTMDNLQLVYVLVMSIFEHHSFKGSVATRLRSDRIFNDHVRYHCWVWWWKNFENRAKFAEVMGKSHVSCLYVPLFGCNIQSFDSLSKMQMNVYCISHHPRILEEVSGGTTAKQGTNETHLVKDRKRYVIEMSSNWLQRLSDINTTHHITQRSITSHL